MTLYSNKPVLTRTRTKDGRNAHLTEAHNRAKKLLHQASREGDMAVRFYRDKVEYWKEISNGRPCSCTIDYLQREKEESEQNGISLDDFLLESVNEFLLSEDYCPVCFGNRIVGGYRRQGTTTIVLDATYPNKVEGVSLVREKPFYLNATDRWGSIYWKINLPRFLFVESVAIKWKSPPRKWELLVDGEKINEKKFNTYSSQPADVELRMLGSEGGLYAIFIQLAVSETLINCDKPRWTVSYTGELNVRNEVQSSITANFGPSLKNPTSTDIMIDGDGYIWRVVEVELNNPMEVNIGFTCQARLVRAFERYFILPSKRIQNKYGSNHYTFAI
jgi:hypothetical protein